MTHLKFRKIALCITILCAWLGIIACNQNPQTNANPTAAPTTPPNGADADKEAAKAAISKGLAHIDALTQPIEPNAALVLHYLQRKFSLNQKYAFTHFYPTYPIAGPKGKAMERMVNPNATATLADLGERRKGATLLDNLSNTSYMMNCALMCDKIPLPDDFFDLLEQQTLLDRYFLTHAAMSLQWLQENNCLTEPNNAQQLKTKQHELLVKLIVNLGKPTDLQMEAIATLLYTGGQNLLQKSWIDAIIKSQLPNGGWALGDFSTDKPHNHATVHALWVLLEYVYPTAPQTNWIMR
ncbi:MAG TPA: hypothetical protein PK239_12760 [Chitinophagales bacterium]|nr:hypothetical protein [Chitinophagales bacterium]HRK28144.1 hypothetical protein [Chitinophagales bacterium]